MDRSILHVDMNACYASIECLYNPEIRDKPVAVGGDAEARHGIILAKNQIAKKYGVTTGEALWQAKQKCPQLVIIKPHYDRYLRFSALARQIYNSFTDQVESFGLDECWLDVSGSVHLFGDSTVIAEEIRERVKHELGIMTMGIELTVQLAMGLIKALPQLIAALPQIISAILNGLGQSVSSMVEIGKNIVSGLWEGIKSMASWLASKVRGFFSGIVKSAKKALGIASPSKVFVGIGENMGDSVGVGFTDAMEDVNKQIQSAIPTSVDVGAIDVLTNLPNSVGLGFTSDLLSEKLDILISEVRRYLPQLAGMQLVADTGATIGWLAPAMDDALGAIRRRKERLT